MAAHFFARLRSGLLVGIEPLVESVAGSVEIDNLTVAWSYGIARRRFNFCMAIIVITRVSLVYDAVTLRATSSEGI